MGRERTTKAKKIYYAMVVVKSIYSTAMGWCSAAGQLCNTNLSVVHKQNTNKQSLTKCSSTILVLYTRFPNPKICAYGGRN